MMDEASAARTADVVAKGNFKPKPNTRLQSSAQSFLSEVANDCVKLCKHASATVRAEHRSRL